MVFQKGNHTKTEFKKGHKPITGFKKGQIGFWKGKHPKSEFKIGNIYGFKKGIHPTSEFKKGHPIIRGCEKGWFKKGEQKSREARAKQIFPIKDTSIEVKVRAFLDALKIEYFQHKYMNIEHAYQCDFFIPSMSMVIECDGDYWHKYPMGLLKDKIRTDELISKGFKVLRLWEHEIKAMELEQFREKLQ